MEIRTMSGAWTWLRSGFSTYRVQYYRRRKSGFLGTGWETVRGWSVATYRFPDYEHRGSTIPGTAVTIVVLWGGRVARCDMGDIVVVVERDDPFYDTFSEAALSAVRSAAKPPRKRAF